MVLYKANSSRLLIYAYLCMYVHLNRSTNSTASSRNLTLEELENAMYKSQNEVSL